MRFNLTKSLDETKLATRLLLDLAADILWSRQQHAHYRATVGTLSELRHPDSDYFSLWGQLKTELDYLIPQCRPRGVGDHGSTAPLVTIEERADSVEKWVSKVDSALRAHVAALESASKYYDPRYNQTIPHLGRFLREAIEWCRKAFVAQAEREKWVLEIDGDWSIIEDRSLACDQDVLRNALYELCRNAIKARHESQALVTIRVDGRIVDRENSGNFAEVIEVRVGFELGRH